MAQHDEIKQELYEASQLLEEARNQAIDILEDYGFAIGLKVQNEKGIFRITRIEFVRHMDASQPAFINPSIHGHKLLKSGKYGTYEHYIGSPLYKFRTSFIRPFAPNEEQVA